LSATALIFDIKEFAVFDGPGIRTTVFFKGCPLACSWCHNPEGLGFGRQLMVSGASCTGCGNCAAVCPLSAEQTSESAGTRGRGASESAGPRLPHFPRDCALCGKCLSVCPLGLRRIAGDEYTAEELAAKLLRNADYLKTAGGGFTVSGGEPMAQGEFLLELLGALQGNHRAIETSGFCGSRIFEEVTEELELIIMDIKIASPELHRRHTGQDNAPILANLERLKSGSKPFIIRIPLIPGITDTGENLEAVAELLKGKTPLQKVELLPYHKTAGAKYGMLGMEYNPYFDTERTPEGETKYFLERDIPCSVL
jgi:pyruvate formate lyase activating enzyme